MPTSMSTMPLELSSDPPPPDAVPAAEESGVRSFAAVSAELWHLPLPPMHAHVPSVTERHRQVLHGLEIHRRGLPAAPDESGSLWSKYTYSWLWPFIRLASEERLEERHFPKPRRDHRAEMCGARLSHAFRDGEMNAHRQLWRPYVEEVVALRGEPIDGFPPSAATPDDDEYVSPPPPPQQHHQPVLRVVRNDASAVFYRGEPDVRGRLRWIGFLTASNTPRQLLAGVEWDSAAHLPAYRATMHPPAAHHGEVHGERLFYPSSLEGPPRCTCEMVEDIVVMAATCGGGGGGSDHPAPPLIPRAPSLFRTILRTYWPEFWAMFSVCLLASLCMTAAPLLLHAYVSFLQADKEDPDLQQRGLTILAVIACVKFIQPMWGTKDQHRAERLGAMLRTTTLTLIFEKCLTISATATAHPALSTGRVLTMASSDVENISNFAMDAVFLVVAPVELFLYVAYLFVLVGYSAAGAVLVFVVSFPLQGLLSRWQGRIEARLTACTDERMRRTNELLSGIRIVKTMGWEKRFLSAVEDRARAEELRYRQMMQLATVLNTLLADAVPPLMIAAVFTSMTVRGHGITPEVAFPVIAIVGTVGWPLMMLPKAITTLVKCRVSAARITTFLECNDRLTTMPEVEKMLGGGGRGVADDGTTAATEGAACADAVVMEEATVCALTPKALPRCRPPPVGRCGALVRAARFAAAAWARRRGVRSPVEMEWQLAELTAEDVSVMAAVEVKPAPLDEAQEGREDDNDDGDDDEDDDDGEENNNNNTTTKKKSKAHTRYMMERTPLLHHLSLRIPAGRLTIVVGPTGSGKSLLLSALMGSLEVVSGRVSAPHSIAYVPQQPWIIQDTIRENIQLFARRERQAAMRRRDARLTARSPLFTTMDVADAHDVDPRLQRAVQCCQLEQDLRELAHGLETEIGEKGINLSGGQKARVSLARAVYADRELYLLDDPLSALDAHVGEKIMTEVVLGALAHKTRILVTHQLHVLPHADQVVVMEGGEVRLCGSYDLYAQSPWKERLEALEQQKRSESATVGGGEGGDGSVDEFSPTTTSAPGFEGAPDGPDDYITCECTEEVEEQHHVAADPSSAKLMVEEEKEVGSVPWPIYGRFVMAAGGYTRALRLMALFIASETLMTGGNVWLSLWSTRYFPEWSQERYLAIYILFILGEIGGAPLCEYVAFGMSREAARHFHRGLLYSITSATVTFFDQTPLGRLVNRFSKDMYVLDEQLPDRGIFFLQLLCYPLFSISIAMYSTPPSVVVMAAAAVGFYILLTFYTRIIREVRRRGSIAQSPMFSLLGEVLSGRESILSYDRASKVFREALTRLDLLYSCTYLEKVINMWLSIRVEYLGCLIMVVVAAIGVVEKLWDQSSAEVQQHRVGLIALSLTMCLDLFWTLPTLVQLAARVEADMNSVQRLVHYMDHVDHEELHLLDASEAQKGSVVVGDGVVAIEPTAVLLATTRDLASTSPPGSLTLTHVNLRYREGLPLVIHDLSLTIAPGEKVGVVGRTGSGKSTLLQAFMGLVPISSGNLCVSGRDHRDYTLPQLRRLFAMIPQDPVLFEGTIRSNLDPFTESTDAEVRRALTLVGLCATSISTPTTTSAAAADAAAADAAPLELTTMVQDGGRNYSVGQRQLLCLARALLKRGSVFMLMDEATANTDAISDQRVQEVVRDHLSTYTVVTIAHRLHTVASYDRVLVMDKGRLVEEGSPRALVQNRASLFFKMVARSAAAGASANEAIPRSHAERVEDAVATFLSQCR